MYMLSPTLLSLTPPTPPTLLSLPVHLPNHMLVLWMVNIHIQWEAPATLCSLDVSLIFQQSGTPEYGGLSKLEGDVHCHTCCFKWIFALRLFYSFLLVNNNHRRNDSKQPNQDHLCSSKSLIFKKFVIEFCQSSQIKNKSFFFTGYGHVLKVLGKQHYCVLTFFIILYMFVAVKY